MRKNLVFGTGRFLALIVGTVALLAGSPALFGQTFDWNGSQSTDWATGANWQGGNAPFSGGTRNFRINVGDIAVPQPVRALDYTDAQGNTIFTPGSSSRALVIGSQSTANGSMFITGGTFDSRGGWADILGNNGGTGSLTIDGGNYNNTLGGSTTFFMGYHGSSTANATLTVNSGSFTTNVLQFGHEHSGTINATIQLNVNGGIGGILAVERFARRSGGTINSTIDFNGGTLRALATRADFMPALTGLTANVRDGGAFIDTNGFNVTIGQPLVANGTGGLTKLGTGTLTLSGVNTYTGATLIDEGTLALGGGGSIATSSTITVGTGATLDISAVSGGWTLGASQTLGGTGTVAGNATIDGNLNPGTSAGVLGFGNDLILGSGAITTLEILGDGMVRGTDYDGIDVAAMLGYGGTLNLDIGTTFGMGSYQFNLFDFTAHTGSFSSVELSGDYNASLIDDGFGVWSATTSGGNESWTFTQGTGILDLTVVPEPGAWLLLLMATACGLLVRRR